MVKRVVLFMEVQNYVEKFLKSLEHGIYRGGLVCKNAVVFFIPDQIHKQGEGHSSHSQLQPFIPTIETSDGTGKCGHSPIDS